MTRDDAPDIRRRADGSIDTDHYTERMRDLRARAMRDWLRAALPRAHGRDGAAARALRRDVIGP